MRVVVDASVVAKWLVPEEGTDAAVRLLDSELIVPDLMFAEVANLLWKKCQRGEMDPPTAQIAMSWLVRFPLAIHASAPLAEVALTTSRELAHPAYDCFYLVLARQSEAPLVTADRRLYARCQSPDAQAWGSRLRLLETA
jgi:predicted nucleic acid-binding protein